MNIHEYQAKKLLSEYKIAVPKGELAQNGLEAKQIASNFSSPVFVVKAQIHAGGRGKGGGVIVCKNIDDVEIAFDKIMGMCLVTHQTGAEGKIVEKVLIEEGASIARELYVAVTLDRTSQCVSVVFSPDGGMDIEEVAEKNPERIFVARTDANQSLWAFEIRELLSNSNLDTKQIRQGVALIMSLLKLAREKDTSLIEINPLCITTEGKFLALDAKIQIDDSALARHPELQVLDDVTQQDPYETKAAELGMNYVRLDGYIGTMVNGAGLAMATMDAIKQAGAMPANFLDVGGAAKEETVSNGFEVMLSDPQVKGILINIFGGILRCDIVAQGIVDATRKINLTLPLVVRLEGTNVQEGRRILSESGLDFFTADTMAEAANKIVELTGGIGGRA